MKVMSESVAVWFGADARPQRIVWAGTRYRVTDTPTQLDFDLSFITHPPVLPGWRFQGTSEAGDTRVFDVQGDQSGQRWRLINVYS